MKIHNLNKIELIKVYNRLKKSTKQFSTLLIRDVFDNIDYEVNIGQNLQELLWEIESNNYHPKKPLVHESPKNKGICRPTTILCIEDFLVYRFCIEQIQDDLFKITRQKNIRGGVKIKGNTTPEGDHFYEKWFNDWFKHNESIVNELKYKDFVVTTDITSYFENINLLILKDMLRSDTQGKKDVLNLLFYFLENTHIRNGYEVNTLNGLLQEDTDCSRSLAYYFLKQHDDRILDFCKKIDATFYRFVDDMTIVVDTEVQGRQVLKQLAHSLRLLGLMSSVEKTQIIDSSTAFEDMLAEENQLITVLQKETLKSLSTGKDISQIKANAEYFYTSLKSQKGHYKSWVKILKRFYTLFGITQSEILFDDIQNQLINNPGLIVGHKLLKYLIRNKESDNFNNYIRKLIEYLYSNENLYPAVESSILEMLSCLETELLDADTLKSINKLAQDTFFKNKNNINSEYARALTCLLIYRFNPIKINQIAKHYCNSDENDNITKKYLISVALVSTNHSLRAKVLEKAKRERDTNISRLINLVQNLDKMSNQKIIKQYLLPKKIFIFKDENSGYKIEENIISSRSLILKDLIAIYTSEL